MVEIKNKPNLVDTPDHLLLGVVEIHNHKPKVKGFILCWFVFILPQVCKKEKTGEWSGLGCGSHRGRKAKVLGNSLV